MHVVLDDDDGARLGDLAQELGRFLGFGVGHARHRLVHQKEFGVLRQQHPDFQPLLLPMAEIGRRQVPLGRQANGFEDCIDPLGIAF